MVGVGGDWATHVVCCAESQITGSPPLLSYLDIVYTVEHEGRHGIFDDDKKLL